MKPLRVLQMIDKSFLGGGQQILLSLARGLDRERFDLSVCSRGDGPMAEAVRRLERPFLPAAFSKKPSLRLVGDLRRLLAGGGFDILHTHGGVAGLFGRWAARKAGTRSVVHTLHGIHYLHYRNPFLRRLFIGLERRFSRFTDAVVCVSEGDHARALRMRLGPASRLRLIRNGVGPPAAGEEPEGMANLLDLRRTHGLEPPVVGTIARLHRQKGLVFLIGAAGAIRDRIPKARVVIVGGGPLEAKFRRMIREKGLDRTVLLLGERTDAAGLLSLFDVFVLPSLWEGLPLVLIEAAARGKPIAATDVEGVREIVRDGETGLLVPSRDPAALAAAVIRLLADPALAGRLTGRAKAEIPPRFTLERMVASYAALYDELADKPL